MNNLRYLTDEELNMLISDTLNEDRVCAPPDILEDIRLKLNAEDDQRSVIKDNTGKVSAGRTEASDSAGAPAAEKTGDGLRRRKIEFVKYCMKVTAAAAAAIIMMFAVPSFTGAHDLEIPPIEIFSSDSIISNVSGQMTDHTITDHLSDMQSIYGKDRHNIF